MMRSEAPTLATPSAARNAQQSKPPKLMLNIRCTLIQLFLFVPLFEANWISTQTHQQPVNSGALNNYKQYHKEHNRQHHQVSSVYPQQQQQLWQQTFDGRPSQQHRHHYHHHQKQQQQQQQQQRQHQASFQLPLQHQERQPAHLGGGRLLAYDRKQREWFPLLPGLLDDSLLSQGSFAFQIPLVKLDKLKVFGNVYVNRVNGRPLRDSYVFESARKQQNGAQTVPNKQQQQFQKRVVDESLSTSHVQPAASQRPQASTAAAASNLTSSLQPVELDNKGATKVSNSSRTTSTELGATSNVTSPVAMSNSTKNPQ